MNKGRIFQINTSKGGVPKLARLDAEVGRLGLEGDEHNSAGIHGGPERAVCLYSLERLLELQQEGHAVFPGAMGENVTLTGLEWPRIQPGVRLRLGELVLLEVTKFTTPCNSLTQFFIDGDYSRVSPKRYPDWSRVYARVLEIGKIRVGDAVSVLS